MKNTNIFLSPGHPERKFHNCKNLAGSFCRCPAIFDSMKRPVIHPDRDKAFVTGAYTDAVLIDGWLYVSGQASVDFNTSAFVLGTIEEETTRTLQNIRTIIETAGGQMDQVVKCTVHLADISDFDRYNTVYAGFFTGVKPARTTVQSVLAEGIKVEIDCVAKIA